MISIKPFQSFQAQRTASNRPMNRQASNNVCFGNNEWEIQEAMRIARKSRETAKNEAQAQADRIRRAIDDGDSDFDEYDGPMNLTFG